MKQVLWANEGNLVGEESVNLFLKSIGLREYSRYMSFNHAYSHEQPLLSQLKYFPWIINEDHSKTWRQGRTGYPLVDAGMRELWATGWLHDRIRVVISSFFVKVLQLPWRWGMKYFWDTLLDADLESDALGWQYVSGTIPDGRQFDRMDNPQFEGYKFDPDGEYVRRWLPEVARLPTEWIHHPWDAPEPVLQAAGIELGSNYPLPIVKIADAKARLQEAVSRMWQIEAASGAAMENGTEEGLRDSYETIPNALLPDSHMETDTEPIRNNHVSTSIRRYGDQMVPSMTSSYFRAESRGAVPSNANVVEEPRREAQEHAVSIGNVLQHPNLLRNRRNSEDSTAESSISSRRDGGIVPVWYPPSGSSYSGGDNGYLQRHTLPSPQVLD